MIRKALIALWLITSHTLAAQKSLGTFTTISSIYSVDNKVLFSANDGQNGEELWVTDGSREGTRLLKDIYQGYYSSSPKNGIVFKGQLFFSAYTNESQSELWKSDGTTEGTVLVKDLTPNNSYEGGANPQSLTVFKDKLYFATSEGDLYKTDGTADGTIIVDGLPEFYSGYVRNLTKCGDFLYYHLTGTTLKRTDGTTITSFPLPEVTEDIYFNSLHPVGSKLFAVMASTYQQKIRLFVLNESNLTWNLLKEFDASLYGSQKITSLTAVNGNLFFNFQRENINQEDTDELWFSNGTPGGTILLKSFPWSFYNSGSEMKNFIAFNNQLFFSNGSATNKSLWKSDGTIAGTAQVNPVAMASPYNEVNPPIISNGELFFCGSIAEYSGFGQLWKSDGTNAGTKPYLSLIAVNEYDPYLLTDHQGLLYFITSKNSPGNVSLWSTEPSPLIQAQLDSFSTLNNGTSINMQSVLADDCSIQLVTVSNEGQKELILSDIQISGNDFYIKGSIPEVLAPKDKFSFSIYFNPSIKGKQTEKITISSNDLTKNGTLIFYINGETLSSNAHGFCEAFNDKLFVKKLYATPTPKSITLNKNTVEENLPAGSIVGTLSATGNVTGFSLVKGVGDEGNSGFRIEGNQLITARSFSFAAKDLFSVRIRAVGSDFSKEDLFLIHISQRNTAITQQICNPVIEPLNFTINDIEINSQGYLFAVTGTGSILISKDDGITWDKLSTGTQARLNKIFFKKDIGYITGDNILLKSDDNGATWFQLYLPFAAAYSFYGLPAFFMNENIGFTSSSSSLIKTTDGGRTWITIFTFSDTPQSIWFSNELKGAVIVGVNSLMLTADGGVTWTSADFSSLGNINGLSSISFADEKSGFLTTYQGLYSTKDGGKTWAKSDVETSFEGLNNVEFIDQHTGYFYGGQYSSRLFTTIDGGNTWQSLLSTTPGRISGVTKSSSGKIFLSHAMDNTGAIDFSTNGGTSWQAVTSLYSQSLYGIDFPTPETGYVLGQYTSYKTIDKGLTWKPMTWIPVSSFHFFDADKGLFSDRYSIYKTTDGGKTLTPVFTPDPQPNDVGILYAYNDQLIFAYSWYSLYRSNDGGNNWTTELLQNHESFYTQDIHFISPTIGYALDLFGDVQKTTDGGHTWTIIFSHNPEVTNSNRSIFFVNEMVGFRAGGSSFLMKTIDGGITWSKSSGNAFLYLDLIDVHFQDLLNGTVVAKNGSIYQTTDGGANWKTIYTNGNNSSVSDTYFNRGNIYVCGEAGSVMKVGGAPSTPAQTAYIYGKETACINDIVKYQLPPYHHDTYQWSAGNALVTTSGSTAEIQFPTAGIYTIQTNQSNSCLVSIPRTLTVTVKEFSEPVIAGPVESIGGVENIIYEVNQPITGLAYNWKITGAESFKNENKPQTSVKWLKGVDNGLVSVIQTDPISGCRVRGNLEVKLNTITGLEDVSDFVVYPNPTSGEVYIQSNIWEEAELTICDALGREYFHESILPNRKKSASLRHAAPGLYFLKTISLNGDIRVVKKIIKN